ncbi:MAG: hypothetical protein HUU50_06020 [Candidatus Brocadiae bacterium]|nr:hypothetical protein [Candidatus Brocadiia bacterium]
MKKEMIFCFILVALQGIFSESLSKEQQYLQKFMKAIIILEEMGNYTFANALAHKLREEEVYQKNISSMEKNETFYKYLSIEKREKNEIPVHRNRVKKDFQSNDALYLIWLLSILKNRMEEPALSESLNETIQKHWKENIPKEVEKQQKNMYEWYERLNKKQGNPWQKEFTEYPNSKALCAIETKDENWMILGETETEQEKKEIFLLKTNSAGNVLWYKKFGGTSNDFANGLIQTKDNGYCILGTTWSFGAGKKDVWLIKTNQEGIKEWEQTYGGKRWEEAFYALEHQEGGFTIAASSNSFDTIHEETWIIKTDKEGIPKWQKSIEGKNTNRPAMIQELESKELIFVGDVQEYSQDWNIRIVKLSADGQKIWEKNYGGPKNDHAVAIRSTEGGGFIVAGHTSSFGNGWINVWLLQIDKDGNKVWDKTIGESGSERPTCLQITKEGHFILAGYYNTFGSERNLGWIIKVSSSGQWIWKKNLGERTPRWIIESKDKGFFVVGEKILDGKSSIFAIKTDEEGRF